jgi:hypothetical protein
LAFGLQAHASQECGKTRASCASAQERPRGLSSPRIPESSSNATREAVANQHFATLEALDTALSARCCTLAAMPEIIRAETRFAWWPATAVAN